MATGAEEEEEEGLGMFADALPLPGDFDDVLHLLDMPDDAADPPVLQPPLTAVPAQQQQQHNAEYYDCQPARTHGFSANARPYWPRMVSDGGHSSGAVDGEPSTSAAADCSGCQVLREVVHSNGLEIAKLCIHGGAPGVFNHAMADVYAVDNNPGGSALPSMTQHSCIDFRGRDYNWVRGYLTDYALRRATGNYAVVSDSLSVFHHVLCIDMNPTSIILLDDDGGGERRTPPGTNACRQHVAPDPAAPAAVVQPTIQIRDTEPDQPAAGPSQPPRRSTDVRGQQQTFHPVAARSALALQRERTGKMKFEDIAPCFHLPIVEAAEKLDVCATVLKGICRRVGVQRWPHRKVKKIDREIAKLRRSGNGVWETNQIQRLSADRRRIFDGVE